MVRCWRAFPSVPDTPGVPIVLLLGHVRRGCHPGRGHQPESRDPALAPAAPGPRIFAGANLRHAEVGLRGDRLIERRALPGLCGRRRGSAAPCSAAQISWPCTAPAARVMDSFISVPPRSLAPASSSSAAPSGPIFTHEAWMLGIERMQREPRHRVHQHRLAEGRPVRALALAGRSAPPCARTAAARTR